MSEQKIALITGASRGIGKAIMLQLAKSGITVAGTATSEKGAESITAAIKEVGGTGQGFVLSVADAASRDACVDGITAAFGAPNIIINNAGITSDNLFLRMREEQWNDVIETNLNAVFHLLKKVIRPMVKGRWGRIVNISSVVGITGNPGQANYCAAKAGMIGMTRSLAIEYAAAGITANVVAPGFIATDMTDHLNEKQQEAILGMIPMKRQGGPEDIAAAVNFLVSDAANYITGETININGGMYMP